MWKEDLKKLLETKENLTDSDIEDLTDKYPEDAKEIWQFIYELIAPEQCKGCKYIGLYNKTYPCNCCTKQEHLKDYYESERDE